jgi:hypothetical protein
MGASWTTEAQRMAIEDGGDGVSRLKKKDIISRRQKKTWNAYYRCRRDGLAWGWIGAFPGFIKHLWKAMSLHSERVRRSSESQLYKGPDPRRFECGGQARRQPVKGRRWQTKRQFESMARASVRARQSKRAIGGRQRAKLARRLAAGANAANHGGSREREWMDVGLLKRHT